MELTQEGVERLNVGENSAARLCKGLLLDAIEAGDKLEAEVKKLREEIAELKKWHYIKDGDYPTLDGEYQVIVELMNHRGAYVTTCDNWDCDLNAFTESCYPENIVAWAELSLQPDDLEDHL